MRPIKAEIEAVTAALNEPHESAEDAATAAIKALDIARTERVLYVPVVRFSGDMNPIFAGLGIHSTKNQAIKAIEKHPAADMARGMAVVPTMTTEGYEELLRRVDAPPASRGQFTEIRLDAQAKRNGWDGKNATRDRFL